MSYYASLMVHVDVEAKLGAQINIAADLRDGLAHT
jgi:hypothetical protein